MKVINFIDFGEADVLQLSDAPEPVLRAHDLLVRNHAVGVNRADLIHRRGGYGRPNFGDSEIMGLEITGEVIAVGAEVNGFKPGDRVMGIVGGGAYAEIARIDYRMAMHIPDGLDYVHAAAVPEVFVTAHEALVHLGRLQAGDAVLIHAAAGGVGSAAVQLAHAVGAKVFATVYGPDTWWTGVRGHGGRILGHESGFAQVDFAQLVVHEVDVVAAVDRVPRAQRHRQPTQCAG
jgi:NADPH2:quinone reductase